MTQLKSLLPIILGLSASPSFAESAGDESLEFPSWQQVQSLDEKQTKAMVKALREMAFNFEKYIDPHLAPEDEAGRESAWLLLLSGKAWAADPAQEPRCMYAGFIIRGNQCRPVEKLKVSVTLACHEGGGTSPKTYPPLKTVSVSLECPRGEILCNPLVFGVKLTPRDELPCSQAEGSPKPICVKVSGDRRNTTRACYFTSKDNSSAESVIKSNPDLWEGFVKDWKRVCDPTYLKESRHFKNRERAQKDVLDTCAWAQWKLREIGYDPAGRGGGRPPPLPASRYESYSPDRDLTPEDRRRNEGYR